MDSSHSHDSFSAPATGLKFPGETPNKVELKHFWNRSKMLWTRNPTAQCSEANYPTQHCSWRPEISTTFRR
eukprot:3686389-Pleurochrysis_carterae.AAC.1